LPGVDDGVARLLAYLEREGVPETTVIRVRDLDGSDLLSEREMKSDTVVRARIDSETKRRATEALRAMGLSVSDAIRLLLVRVADEKRLPFSVQVPNSATIEAMEELEEGKARRFDSAEELFRELDL